MAPPGAGKTTVTPLAMLGEPWLGGGKLILLAPRRLAARAAAARMAASLGEVVGETVGYRVRMDSRISARTRIEVVTEGVFTRMILDDPGLDGVSGVILDEFHERSLDGDLGLAFALESQALLREDLRLLVMSATLDGAAVSRLMADAPVIESVGRAFPVETRYLGRDQRASIEDQTVRAIELALPRESGGILVFLPGQGEILRVAQRARERIPEHLADIRPLYGALSTADQDLAIGSSETGRRTIVLSTAIAQTSLTIEGVRTVIDAGLARVPRHDPASGLTRLATVRVSLASADQRRGRAGRTAPGVCYRLWDEAETRGLAPAELPEILETDLTRLALDLARWGTRDLADLALLDRPSPASLELARAGLREMGALGEDGTLTEHGSALSRMAVPPRLAHMVLAAGPSGQALRAARMAVLITERGLGGNGVDIAERLSRLEADRSPRARDAMALAGRLAGQTPRRGLREDERDDGVILAQAYPQRIAKRRGGAGAYQLASGRGVFLDPAEPLAREPWLAVAELGGGAARDRILLAARLDAEAIMAGFADRMRREVRLAPGPGGGLRATETLWLGRLAVEERLIANPDPGLIEAALMDEARRLGPAALGWGERSAGLRARIAFLRGQDEAWPDLSDGALHASLEEWLAPLIAGKTHLGAVGDAALEAALRSRLDWELARRLDVEAPMRWTAPTGSSVAINYGAEGGPRVEIRVQELFGLTTHPAVGSGVPLTLALLSPARRPIQVTTDLPGFWRGSWTEVRKEMRGRYPKHPWPDDPAAAAPTTRAKPRP